MHLGNILFCYGSLIEIETKPSAQSNFLKCLFSSKNPLLNLYLKRNYMSLFSKSWDKHIQENFMANLQVRNGIIFPLEKENNSHH
jgi:hypothetical protein